MQLKNLTVILLCLIYKSAAQEREAKAFPGFGIIDNIKGLFLQTPFLRTPDVIAPGPGAELPRSDPAANFRDASDRHLPNPRAMPADGLIPPSPGVGYVPVSNPLFWPDMKEIGYIKFTPRGWEYHEEHPIDFYNSKENSRHSEYGPPIEQTFNNQNHVQFSPENFNNIDQSNTIFQPPSYLESPHVFRMEIVAEPNYVDNSYISTQSNDGSYNIHIDESQSYAAPEYYIQVQSEFAPTQSKQVTVTEHTLPNFQSPPIKETQTTTESHKKEHNHERQHKEKHNKLNKEKRKEKTNTQANGSYTIHLDNPEVMQTSEITTKEQAESIPPQIPETVQFNNRFSETPKQQYIYQTDRVNKNEVLASPTTIPADQVFPLPTSHIQIHNGFLPIPPPSANVYVNAPNTQVHSEYSDKALPHSHLFSERFGSVPENTAASSQDVEIDSAIFGSPIVVTENTTEERPKRHFRRIIRNRQPVA